MKQKKKMSHIQSSWHRKVSSTLRSGGRIPLSAKNPYFQLPGYIIVIWDRRYCFIQPRWWRLNLRYTLTIQWLEFLKPQNTHLLGPNQWASFWVPQNSCTDQMLQYKKKGESRFLSDFSPHDSLWYIFWQAKEVQVSSGYKQGATKLTVKPHSNNPLSLSYS